MKIKHYTEVDNEAIIEDGVVGVKIRWMLGPADDMPNFFLRIFEVEPGGYNSPHTHPYEHEIYIAAGEGETVDTAGNIHLIRAGNVVYFEPDEEHFIRNTGSETLRFLCMIPKTDT